MTRSRYRALWKQLLGNSSTWSLVVVAVVLAGLLGSSLEASGASTLFQSVISPPGPEPTETPVVTAEPTVVTTPTIIIVEPTPFPTPGELPPALPTAPGQPTVPPPPTAVVEELPTFTPVAPVPIPTVAPQPTTGGPAPILWIIVGLVIVGLVVVIAISPKKPKEE